MQKNIPVTIPKQPKNFLGLPQFAHDTRRAIKELAAGSASQNGLAKTGFVCPFRLEAQSGATCRWRVFSNRSFVHYLTNGVVIDLTTGGADWKVGGIPFDTYTNISASKYIVLKAAVTGLATSNWELVAADPAVATEWQEVHVDGGTGEQDEVRLIIGSIVYDAGSSTVRAYQSVYSPQMLTIGLVNGAAAIQFIPAPIHPDSLGS